ncbi:hypothetical protein Tco_0949672, partial [Tanacetum coccineum]
NCEEGKLITDVKADFSSLVESLDFLGHSRFEPFVSSVVVIVAAIVVIVVVVVAATVVIVAAIVVESLVRLAKKCDKSYDEIIEPSECLIFAT